MSLTQMMQIISLSLFEKSPIEELFVDQEPKELSNQQSLFENLTGQ